MSAPSSPQVFQFSCDVAGALLLLDPVLLDRFDDAIRYALAIAIDPDGNSDLSSDFLGDPGMPCTPGWRGHPNIGRFGPEDVAASGTRPEVHNAIVKRIEDGTAYMAILVSGGVQSGYAEAPVGTRSIQPRQKVNIRLLAKQGGRWIAELV